MKHWIIENRDWVIGVVSTITAWFGGRKLKKSNEVSADLNNLSEIRKMEKALVDDAQEIIKDLRETIDSLQNLIQEKNKFISEQKKVIDSQRKALNKCKHNCNV